MHSAEAQRARETSTGCQLGRHPTGWFMLNNHSLTVVYDRWLHCGGHDGLARCGRRLIKHLRPESGEA